MPFVYNAHIFRGDGDLVKAEGRDTVKMRGEVKYAALQLHVPK
jgi:hypothetical protein